MICSATSFCPHLFLFFDRFSRHAHMRRRNGFDLPILTFLACQSPLFFCVQIAANPFNKCTHILLVPKRDKRQYMRRSFIILFAAVAFGSMQGSGARIATVSLRAPICLLTFTAPPFMYKRPLLTIVITTIPNASWYYALPAAFNLVFELPGTRG